MNLQDAMRKLFRVNVTGRDDISVKINNVEYEVIDVGDNGIGIKLSPEDIFISVDDELQFVLNIKGASHSVQGKVVHISPEGPGELLCGIQLINPDEESNKHLLDYVKSCKENIFKEE